ncbi:MAG: YraN family protein [Candidatus Yanofskybacteria bacterium]|nr:YraN family protein [Candidatus Yanofskybacteria bacterium]
MSRSEFGRLAELTVSKELEAKGYKILAQNYRKPWGEIDIIAQKDKIISFVEVKASHQLLSGFEPELRANPDKIKRIIKTARTYLSEKKYTYDQPWQIDVVAITLQGNGEIATLNHFKNIDV